MGSSGGSTLQNALPGPLNALMGGISGANGVIGLIQNIKNLVDPAVLQDYTGNYAGPTDGMDNITNSMFYGYQGEPALYSQIGQYDPNLVNIAAEMRQAQASPYQLPSDFYDNGSAQVNPMQALQQVASSPIDAVKAISHTSISPTATQQYWKSGVFDPLKMTFDQEIAPKIDASYAAQGSMIGSQRANAQRVAMQNLNTQALAQLAQMQQSNQQLEANLSSNESTSSAQMNLQRALAQAGFDQEASKANASNYLQQLLNYNDNSLKGSMFNAQQKQLAKEFGANLENQNAFAMLNFNNLNKTNSASLYQYLNQTPLTKLQTMFNYGNMVQGQENSMAQLNNQMALEQLRIAAGQASSNSQNASNAQQASMPSYYAQPSGNWGTALGTGSMAAMALMPGVMFDPLTATAISAGMYGLGSGIKS